MGRIYMYAALITYTRGIVQYSTRQEIAIDMHVHGTKIEVRRRRRQE